MNVRSTFFHRAGAIAGLFLLIALSRPAWSQLKQEPVPPPAPRAPANQEDRAMAGQKPAEVARWIDREIQQQLDAAKIPASPVADDAEFCRRAHLDIIGRIPSLDQVKSFLASQDLDKRAKLIDELLASPEYGKHFGKIWSDLIVRQEVIDYQLVPPFTEALANSFNENQGWNRIVSELLTAQGTPRENPRVARSRRPHEYRRRDQSQVSRRRSARTRRPRAVPAPHRGLAHRGRQSVLCPGCRQSAVGAFLCPRPGESRG